MAPNDDASTANHRVPASIDWPRGYGEASWWPIAVVVGVFCIYAGLGLTLISLRSALLLTPLLGPTVVVLGIGLFLIGLGGWTFHGFVAQYEFGSPGHETRYRWGMGMFLCSEVATFGSGLAYYGYVRIGPWPPDTLPPLLSPLLAINTVVLLVSSVTLHFAHRALQRDRRRRFTLLLGSTLLLGAIFLLGQAREYHTLLVEEGFTITDGTFASAFFGLTGLHGLHVGLGLVLLAIVFGRGMYGQYSATRHDSVTTVTMYWHFVDAVWIILVVSLYLGAVVP